MKRTFPGGMAAYPDPAPLVNITLLACVIFASLAFASDPISFREFPADDSIHVTFTTTGCFHHATWEFDFQRAEKTSAVITLLEQHWDEAAKRQVTNKRIPLGTVTLSNRELAGLDRLLAFYRSNQPGGCTTVDRITVTQKSGEREIATESYTDATCATDGRKDLTLFLSLIPKDEPK